MSSPLRLRFPERRQSWLPHTALFLVCLDLPKTFGKRQTFISDTQFVTAEHSQCRELILVPTGDTLDTVPGNLEKKQKIPRIPIEYTMNAFERQVPVKRKPTRVGRADKHSKPYESTRNIRKASLERIPHAQTIEDRSTARIVSLEPKGTAAAPIARAEGDAEISPVANSQTPALHQHPRDPSLLVRQDTAGFQMSFVRDGTTSSGYSIQTLIPANIPSPITQWPFPNQLPSHLPNSSAQSLGHRNNFLTDDSPAYPSSTESSTFTRSFQCHADSEAVASHAGYYAALLDPTVNQCDPSPNSLEVTTGATSVSLCHHDRPAMVLFRGECGCHFAYNVGTNVILPIFVPDLTQMMSLVEPAAQPGTTYEPGQTDVPPTGWDPGENIQVPINWNQAHSYEPGNDLEHKSHYASSFMPRRDRLPILTIPEGSLCNGEYREPQTSISTSTPVSAVGDLSTPASEYFSPQSARSNIGIEGDDLTSWWQNRF